MYELDIAQLVEQWIVVPLVTSSILVVEMLEANRIRPLT
jgi:hypothetical protein